MQTKDTIIWVVLFILSLGMIFFAGFYTKGRFYASDFDTTITTTLRFDSTIRTIDAHPGTQIQPNTHTIIKTDSTVYVVPVLDTLALTRIIESWFTHYYYSQTLRDSNIEASIKDTISQNRIISRHFTYKILRPDSIVTSTITQPKNNNNIYAGMGVCWGTNPKIGPALIVTRNRFAFQAGAAFGQQQPVLLFGTYYKLK